MAIHYQPILYLHDLTRILGYEALLRCPARQSPYDLLQKARHAGTIPAWELQILERAVKEVLLFKKRWDVGVQSFVLSRPTAIEVCVERRWYLCCKNF